MRHPPRSGDHRGARVATPVVIGALLILLAAAASLAAAPAPDAGAPQGALAASGDVGGLGPAGGAASLKSSGMDTALAGLARVTRRNGQAAARRFAASRGLDLRRGKVRVIVVARDARPGSLALVGRAVRAAGGHVTATYGSLAQAYVPPGRLEALAGAAGVLDLRQPGGYALDAVTSEGVGEMAANVWSAAGFTGAGVKVGIIDAGFKGYKALLGTELPAAVTTWGGSVLGPEGGVADDVDHGTAVAEIVHDVAPGARLYLAMVDDPVELGRAEQWMVAQGVRVINHSMGWWGWGQTNGTGIINQPVTHAVSKGVFWANSAGNSRLMHWMGDFTDPNGDFYMDFANDLASGDEYNTFYAPSGWYVNGCLWWDDSFAAATQDFDLFLGRLNTSTGAWTWVASSQRRQGGSAGETPVEVITYTTPAAGYYGWQVTRAWSSRTAVDFDLFSTRVDFDDPYNPYPHYFDHERSFSQPADNASVGCMAVGAIGRPLGFLQADYSSQGPTRDGRVLPEISGPTEVSTATMAGFNGTSAASPHVAGIAAVLRQAYPSYTAAQTENLIKSLAVDLGTAGPDNAYGWGRVQLPAVPVDTTRPVTKAGYESVRRGTYAVLPYRVNDAGFSAGPAKVTIVIKNRYGRIVKTLGPVGNKPMCTALTWRFRCGLAKGTYRFYVKATDAAGLRATIVGNNKLVVR